MFRNILFCISLIASSGFASAIETGKPLPALKVADKGELVLNAQNEIGFQPWSSEKMNTEEKVQIVQYMAARPSAESQIRPFTDRLEAQQFPFELHNVVTVVNLSDVTFGASGWALSELQSNKRKHPEAVLVGDWNGVGQKTWGLQRKSSALFVLDNDGSVLFAKDGQLTSIEINRVIELIRSEIDERKAAQQAALNAAE